MAEFRINVIVDPSRARSGGRQVTRELRGIENAADRVRTGLLRMFGAAAAGAAAAQAIRSTIQYQTALAEVSTLVNEATFDIQGLNKALLEQSAAFGQSPVQQAQAAYQIISAGATSAAEATELLTAANRLAIGGVTDVATAADGLTSVLNAYGDGVKSAADVSDILFVGVRQGKTTIDQLSASIGRVAPLASSTGVAFEELVSAIAALTKGGISTNEAVTGTRAILAAVAKPSSEAAKLAQALGLEFNTAAIRARGFSGFLEEVVEKTDGNNEALAQLFGGVEALVPVLALAGKSGDDFTETLEQMEDRAGSTEDAFEKLANSPGFQLQRIFAALQAEAIATFQVFTQALVPALRAIADNIDVVVFAIKVLIGTLTVLAGRSALGAAVASIRAMIAVLATMQTLLGTTGAAAVVFGGALRTAATIGVAAFGALLSPIALIATAVGGVIIAVNNLRNAFASLKADAADSVSAIASASSLQQLEGLEDVIEQNRRESLEGSASGASGFVNGLFGRQEEIDSLVNDRADQALAAVQKRRAELQNLASDSNLINLASTTTTPETTKELSKVEQILADLKDSGESGAGGVAKVNEEIQRLQNLAQELNPLDGADGLNQRARDLETLFNAGRISVEQFTAAMKDLNVEISALDNSFSGGIANGIDRIIQRTNDLGSQVSNFVVGAFDQASDAIVNFAKTGQFNVREFFGTLFSQLLKLATDQLFAQLLQGFGGGGGLFGGGGGLFGGLGSLLGFQNGGDFRVGGSGGTDSQLVAFRATPNETVSVRTPGQAAAEGSGGNNSSQPVVVQAPPVNVLFGDKDVARSMGSADGQAQTINALQANRRAARAALGI